MFDQYSCRWACLNCRKAFKLYSAHEFNWAHPNREVKCPECGNAMVDVGRDYRVPKKGNKNKWKVLEALVDKGFGFHTCGCGGDLGFIPRTFAETKRTYTKAKR